MAKQRGGPVSTLVNKMHALLEIDILELNKLSNKRTETHEFVVRINIVLLLAQGNSISYVCEKLVTSRPTVRLWARRYLESGINGLRDAPRPGRPPKFNPIVAALIVKIACEMPEKHDRSQAIWFCTQIADTLKKDHSDIVDSISAETVRRILCSCKLKPWRKHMWLSEKKPRDKEWCNRVRDVIKVYTRKLAKSEVVLCVDEMTSIQPRPRTAPTKPAVPGRPVQVEHEYKRDGALNLFAAFNTRTGVVFGKCFPRKRQFELIEFLEYIDEKTPPSITKIRIVCDNCPTHHGELVQGWAECHPRFIFHYTPVHCSWCNQVEQWFSILQRRRFCISNFENLEALRLAIDKFIQQWNEDAHPFKWTKETRKKVFKYVRKVEKRIQETEKIPPQEVSIEPGAA